jgi:ATP-dependent Clp protease, protease subunit
VTSVDRIANRFSRLRHLSCGRMTTDGQPTGAIPPTEVYGLFAGVIDQLAVQRFHNAMAIATTNAVQRVHLVFQCSGGLIGDGISLYNLFRVCPIDLTLYNVGSICSIGVIAFLGAKNRKISQYATFMIHRSYVSPAMATSDRLMAAADQIIMDDERIETILKLHTKIPADKWDMHKFSDVWISAKELTNLGRQENLPLP